LKVHFIGIGGIGLSALARFMRNEGYEVSGSDMSDNGYVKKLRDEGFVVTTPHNPSCVECADLVIHSAAIKMNNVELVRAKELGIKTLPRKDALPLVLGDKKVYSVCGAHGKSTTTAILSAIFENCSALIGAESKEFKSNTRHIKNSDCVVFEADESDSSFLNSNPHYAIVTNAEPEHMEHYGYDLERFYSAYKEFLQKAKKRVINAEDAFLATLDIDAIKLYPSKDIKNISFTLVEDEPHTEFELKDYGRFEVWGFGNHIALDASLAILCALEEGLELEEIRRNLKKYKGIKKRFDILEKDSTVVIDDYAHHPTEIEATLSSTKLYASLKGVENIVSIWQPHKYSRTISNLERFKECFRGSSRLIILPVWSAGEDEVIIDFESNFGEYNLLLADRVGRESDSVVIFKNNQVVETIQNGVVVGFGAGDITYQLRGLVQ